MHMKILLFYRSHKGNAIVYNYQVDFLHFFEKRKVIWESDQVFLISGLTRF